MAKVTVALRMPNVTQPWEITVDAKDYEAGDWGVLVTKEGIQRLYPWHKVDWVAKKVSGD